MYPSVVDWAHGERSLYGPRERYISMGLGEGLPAVGTRAHLPGITMVPGIITALGIITVLGISLMAPAIKNLPMGHDAATEAAKLVGYLLIVVYRNILLLATFIMFWVTNTS
jgi:hypothetical protein